MSVFCLVHGSTQGPMGWELLVSELTARGHDCICVDLPTDQPDLSATAYAYVIGDALANSNSAIVVAHLPSSYVSCSEDRALNPDWWEMAARERLRSDPIRMKAGHAPHVSRAAALAAILDSLTTS